MTTPNKINFPPPKLQIDFAFALKRLPVEFQVVTLHETVRRNKQLMTHKATQEWINESSVTLF